MPASLNSLSNDFAALVEQTSASVVAVHSRPRFNSSGVHWSPGIVVTSEHALRENEGITITNATEKHSAELVGRDLGSDIAVLRVEKLSIPTTSREDVALKAGALVAAVGRNQESAQAALGAIGSITGASQTWRGGKLDKVIRLDLHLHPVGAGSAVVDMNGKLIGIATPALSRAAVFAVPVSTVARVVDTILKHGRVPQGYLGAGLQPIALPEHLMSSLGVVGSVGLLAVSVDPDAPAGKAGLLIGDILIELNGQSIDRPEKVRHALADTVGKTIPAKVIRGGAIASLNITIAERPSRK
jgi:S1-C subfamily serine protease